MSNYEAGDHRLLEPLLTSFVADADQTHWFCMDLLRIFETNRSDDAKASMLFVYERTPCASCRQDSVKVMHVLGVLPASVADECRYDSEEETRALVGASTNTEGTTTR